MFDSGPGTSFEKAVSVKIQKRLFLFAVIAHQFLCGVVTKTAFRALIITLNNHVWLAKFPFLRNMTGHY